MREAFSFWTGHPFDFELWVRTAYWVAHGVSPYGVLPAAPGLSFASVYSRQATSTIGYLPFWPLLMAGIYDLYAGIGIQSRFLLYFLLKQPMIVGDVMLGYAIYRYVALRGLREARWVLYFWLLSPLNIILSAVWGMFDSLSILFVVLALNARGQTFRALGSGMATFIKSIPVIYAIPLCFSGTKKLRSLLLALGVPALVSLVVITAAGWPLQTVFSTLSSTVSKGGESLSAADVLFYLSEVGLVTQPQLAVMKPLAYAWVIAEIVALLVAYRRFGFRDERGLVQSLLLCTLVFLIFRLQVNEQYTLYLFALSLIDVAVWNPRRKDLLVSLLGVTLAYLVVNSPLLIRFASPVFPGVLGTEQFIIMVYNINRLTLKLLLAMTFTGLNVWYLAVTLKGGRTSSVIRAESR